MNKKFLSICMSGVLSLTVILGAGMNVSEGYTSYERISGSNRYETSIKVSKKNKSDIIVLASGKSYPDALSAVNISNKFNGQTILTNGEISIINVIKSRNAKKIYIVGGESSVPKSVEEKIKADGFEVERIAGSDRYETSRNTIKVAGYKSVGVCSGQNYIDALSAAALLKQDNSGLLLVNGKKPYTVDSNINVKYTFGGVNSVIQNGGERISGTSRYSTAVEIANRVKNPKSLAIVSGSNYPDALSATNLIISDNAVIMPVDKIAYYDVIKKAKEVDKLFVVGGDNSVSQATINDILDKTKTDDTVTPSKNVSVGSELTPEQKKLLEEIDVTGNGVIAGIDSIEKVLDKIDNLKSLKPGINSAEISKLLDELKPENINNIINNADKIKAIISKLDKIDVSKLSSDIEQAKELKSKITSIKNKLDVLDKKLKVVENLKGLEKLKSKLDKIIGN